MDPLRPEPPDGQTVPLRQRAAPAAPPVVETPEPDPPKPTDTPPLAEVHTVSLRGPNAAAPPADAVAKFPVPPSPRSIEAEGEMRTMSLRFNGTAPPSGANPPPESVDSSTGSVRQVQNSRATLEHTSVPPAKGDSGVRAGPVSIRQIMEMRALMEADEAKETKEATAAKPPEVPETPAPVLRSELTAAPRGKRSDPVIAAGTRLDPSTLCPKCGEKLISPESLGMCPSCGYCRSLEEGKDKVPTAEKGKPRLSLFGLVEFCQLLAWVPAWCWLLLGGVGLIVLMTLYVRPLVANDTPARESWGLVLICIGAIGLIIAHVWALLQVALEYEKAGFFDLFFLLLRIWGVALRRLPSTSGSVVLASWSTALVVSSICIAGLPFTGLADGMVAKELRQAMAGISRNEYRSLASTAASDIAASPRPAASDSKERENDKRGTVQCVVIGFQLDERGRPDGLIIATLREGVLKYAGVVRDGVKKQAAELFQRMNGLDREDGPPGSDKVRAIWVRPEASVEVHHSGLDGKGKLQEPNLRRVLNGGDE
ncbi:MAG: hypothetical protein K2R98_11145 [Gemmataceae bacterium]|nr:hypothetical protein [Gemmataceae bacterium]